MPTTFSFGKIQFDVSLGTQARRPPRDPESPFCLALLGDFTGRSNRGASESVALRRPIHADCDNFENVFAKLGVLLHLPAPNKPDNTLELRFGSMDDFHPDCLIKQISSFAGLLEVRKRLQNSATADAAIAEAQRLLSSPLQAPAQAAPAGTTSESTDDTLARLMGKAPIASPATARPSSGGVNIQSLIQNIVAPHVVPGATTEQTVYSKAVEEELATQLRAVLHHPTFQALEATWRGTELLVREHGAEENVKLFLIDVSKEELVADLKAHEELQQTGFFKLIRDQSWAALLCAFTFTDRVEDIEALGRIAKIASRHGASFIAGGHPHLVGCDSFALHPDPDDWQRPLPAGSRDAWQALRKLAEASYVGLALPRFLLRQPYGKNGEPVEALPFEELTGERHEAYLWGNPAFLCGYLLLDAFRAEGWEMTASGSGELGDLPVYKFTQDGETKVKPCAEAWLTDRAAERILAAGLMPIQSIKGRDAVRLVNLQSIAELAKPLSLHCR